MKTPTSQTRPLLIYGAIILVLFLIMLPYSYWLEREKTRKDLGEATIGQIDTGSFMLKLALLGGARGIAANVLWTKAVDLQKAQEWDRLKATVDLITKLQPHFLSVWVFQGWNLAYNVSVEWDSPDDKYEWIKQGIKFLQEGVTKNKKSPDLLWYTAFTYYHKIGFSDEAIVLRRLFFDDDDEKFKTEPIEHAVKNDNFQLGWGWFTRAINLVDSGETRLGGGGSTPLVEYVDAPEQHKGRPDDLAFRAMPAHAQTRYAAGLEKQSVLGIEATFGEKARSEWDKALQEWTKFGKFTWMSHNEMRVPSSIPDAPTYKQPIQIDDVFDRAKIERLAKDRQYWANLLKIPLDQVSEVDARKLADNMWHWADRWASQMNYPYWKDRCLAEREPDGVNARRLFYQGTKAYKAGDYPEAEKNFAEGLAIWAKLLERHEHYRKDDLNRKDTGLILRRYLKVLTNVGKPVPEDLPFKDLLKESEGDIHLDPFDAMEMPHTQRG
jgi:hypothetical protein